VPGEGEVVKSTLRGQRREVRRVASRTQSRNYQSQRAEQHEEIGRGAVRGIAGLKPVQRPAVFHAVLTEAPVDGQSGPLPNVEAAVGRFDHIVGENVAKRAMNDSSISPEGQRQARQDFMAAHAERTSSEPENLDPDTWGPGPTGAGETSKGARIEEMAGVMEREANKPSWEE
jgi:hypothetical protein